MKQKVFKCLEIIGESLCFLIINYTLSSMFTSFDPHWYSILFRAADIFVILKYYDSMKRITQSKFWANFLFILNLLIFAILAWKIGYIKGEFTPFTRIF